MQHEVVQVSMEKAVYFFGTTISFLLTIIVFFLHRFIKTNDEAIRDLKNTTADHGVRIAVVEEKLQ